MEAGTAFLDPTIASKGRALARRFARSYVLRELGKHAWCRSGLDTGLLAILSDPMGSPSSFLIAVEFIESAPNLPHRHPIETFGQTGKGLLKTIEQV